MQKRVCTTGFDHQVRADAPHTFGRSRILGSSATFFFSLFLLTIISLATPGVVSAGSYYVDGGIAQGGDGRSWASAWPSFGAIEWSQLGPGDTLYISGGQSSRTYHESLVVGAEGTANAPLTITKGTTAGHAGRVILDGQFALPSGVQIEDADYITVRGLQVQHFVGNGQIRVRYSRGVVVEDNVLVVTGHGGVYLWTNEQVTVRHNRITTPQNSDAQTDGIYSQHNTGNEYAFNDIVISNQDPGGHNDGIQLHRDTDTTLHANYIEQANEKELNAQGIFATDCYGTIRAYNNIIYGPATKNAILTLWLRDGGDAKLEAYHNTLIGGGWGVLYIGNSPQSEAKNNILVSDKSDTFVLRLSGAVPPGPNIDYNLYYAPQTGVAGLIEGQTNFTWGEWQARGYEGHGVYADPALVAVSQRDFTPQAPSPVVDAGTALSAPYLVDWLGTVRPQGAAPDLGAVEALLGNLPPPDPPDGPDELVVPIPLRPSGESGTNPPTFEWEEVAEAKRYMLEVENVSTNKTVLRARPRETSYARKKVLRLGSYQWRVKAKTAEGWGEWSEWLPFSIPSMTDPPTPLRPSGDSNTNPPTFEWEEVVGAKRYWLEVENTSTNNRVMRARPRETSYARRRPLATGPYQWRVKAKTAEGWGEWSEWTPFNIP